MLFVPAAHSLVNSAFLAITWEAALYVDVIFRDEEGKVLGKLVANEKTFASGSRGFYANGKIEIAGKRYQCQAQLVEIGSKPAEQAKG